MSSHTSSLTDLPLELFRTILGEAVRVRGLNRALRLRLVNKQFSDELVEALCASNVINDCWVRLEDWPYARPYIELRLLQRRTQGLARLHVIRKTAEILASHSSAQFKYEEYALQLLDLASTAGAQDVRLLLLKGPGTYEEHHSQYDLLCAASLANNITLVESLVDTELGIFAYTFGDPFIAAVVGGSHEVLTLLLAEDGKKNLLGTSGRKRLLSAAAERGDEQTVLYILQSGYNPLSQPPPRNVEHRTRSWEMTQTTKLLRTPSVEVFETIMDDMESWDRLPLGNTFLAHCLEAAIRNGWADMTRYLITFGTPVDTRFPCASLEDPLYWACKYGRGDVVKLLIDNTRASDNSEVIIYGMNLSIAASRGHSSVVKIILESGGLDPDASHRDVLYAAARKGYLDTVKVLLDAGMDPNAGKIHLPLVGAVESEHTDMFRLLIQQGADVTRALPEATRAAEAAGLDSMLALLSEYRTTEHTNCV